MEAPAREVARLCLCALLAAGCGVKGPPRPPGAEDEPPAAIHTVPQPGLEGVPAPVVPEAVPPADVPLEMPAPEAEPAAGGAMDEGP